ncbi:MAG: nucleotide exchange factor GrpE [Eubacteriales bacterium]|nr:nucleotide exchange factor GrpE [Eubacteriales bacterium]
MSKDEKKNNKNNSIPDEEVNAKEADANTAESNECHTVPEDENISVAEAKMRKQLDEQNDKYVRLYAEYDNYRKRSAKEKTDAYTDAYATAVKAFLPLLDNLERALEYEKDNEGFRMILKQMNDIFDKLGVKEIESDGKEFDPNLHNAIIHEDDPEKGENLVLQTLQKGYTMNGKVIRHAMVKVVN